MVTILETSRGTCQQHHGEISLLVLLPAGLATCHNFTRCTCLLVNYLLASCFPGLHTHAWWSQTRWPQTSLTETPDPCHQPAGQFTCWPCYMSHLRTLYVPVGHLPTGITFPCPAKHACWSRSCWPESSLTETSHPCWKQVSVFISRCSTMARASMQEEHQWSWLHVPDGPDDRIRLVL